LLLPIYTFIISSKQLERFSNFKQFFFCLILLFLFTSTHAQSDPLATCQTQSLYQQLKNLRANHLLFGHQNSTLEGLGWEDLNGFEDKSDCLEAVGDYPAVVGFDFVRGFIFQRHTIRAHERGAMITFSDHMDNFKTRGGAWDAQNNSVAGVLEAGSAAQNRLIQHLDKVASFFNGLLDENGDLIPVIYRPFHENTGDWFWWGTPYCTAEEYVALWKFTVDYLRNTRNIHHVLYAYSPSDPAFLGGYNARYPGDDYVDIIGFDSYAVVAYEMFLVPNAQLVVEFAAQRNKVAALTEFGVNGGIQFANETDWFTNVFLAPLKNDSIAKELAYAHTWRNDRANHHWIPLPNSPNHPDFVNFYEDEFTLFEADLPDLYDCSILTNITDTPTLHYEEAMLTIGPNPTTGYLNIQCKQTIPSRLFNLRIMDSTGRMVLNHPFHSLDNPIDVQQLPTGIYFLTLSNANLEIPFQTSFFKL